MNRNRFAGLIALSMLGVLSNPAAAQVPEELLVAPLAEIFGAPPTVGEPMLSPDGTHLVFQSQDPGGSLLLRALTIGTGELRTLNVGSRSDLAIAWCDFANETRLLCDMRRENRLGSIEYQELFAINLNGTTPQAFPRGTGCLARDADPTTREHNYRPEPHEHSALAAARGRPRIDRFPDDPERILLVCRDTAYLLDVYRHVAVEAFEAGDFGDRQVLYSDGNGLARIYSGHADGEDRWFTSADPATGEWRQFRTVDRAGPEAPFRPLGFGTSPDRLLNLAWNADTGTWGIYRQSLSEPYENALVFAHEDVDIEVVDTIGRDNRVVAAAFLDGAPQRAIFDRRVADVFQFISGLLPGVDVRIVDESWDQRIYLARAQAPQRAAEYLLINMETEQVGALLPEYDHLAGFELAATELVQFDGTGGARVTAHLTLPHDSSGPVPAVIMPRARASHEELAEPHYLVQFLAASGYAVLRVQNGVGEEQGRGWSPARAAAGWQQSAEDLAAAADFLVDSGLTEAGRICAVGKDYGAYAALLGSVADPELFACIVGIGAVTDPRLTPAAAGAAPGVLEAASPILRAAEIEAPVLLLHGGEDSEFSPAEHSAVLAAALERADRTGQYVVYPREHHEIRRGPHRIDLLTRLGAFLESHIGPAMPRIEMTVDDAGSP